MIKKTSPRRSRSPSPNRRSATQRHQNYHPQDPYPMASTNVASNSDDTPGFLSSLARGTGRGLYWLLTGLLYPEYLLIWHLADIGGYPFTREQREQVREETTIRVISIILHILGTLVGLVLFLSWIAPRH